MRQKKFIDSIQPTEFNSADSGVFSGEHVALLRQLVGKLQWCASQTRPDIAFTANTLMSNLDEADFGRLKLANKANKVKI